MLKKPTLFYVIPSFVSGTWLGYQAKTYKQAKTIPVIKIPAESKTGEPLAIFELPDEQLDETRLPAKDNITPANAKQGVRSNQANIGDEINGWNTHIPPDAFLKLHRHPYTRFLFSWTDGHLNRQQGDKTHELKVKKNTFMIFAPDPKSQFHNDFNPSKEQEMNFTVVEVKPRNNNP